MKSERFALRPIAIAGNGERKGAMDAEYDIWRPGKKVIPCCEAGRSLDDSWHVWLTSILEATTKVSSEAICCLIKSRLLPTLQVHGAIALLSPQTTT